MPSNASWPAVSARTQPSFGDEIFDAVSTNNSLVWMLRQAGNIKISDGGRTFTHALIWSTNSSFAPYSKYGTIATPDPDILTRSEWDVKIIAGAIVLSMLEQAQNQGKAAILRYLEEKKLEASISLTEELGNQLVTGTGTGTSWDSLGTIISTTNTTTVGGIAGSDASWRNNVTAIGGAFNTTSNGLTALSTATNASTFGKMGPRAIFTTPAVWTLYDIGQAANIRYYNSDLADAGFKHLMYSTMPFLWDDSVPAGRIYGVDTDHLWLQVLRQGNVVTTDFRPSVNQLSDVALLYVFGNLTTGSRRTNFVITGVTS